MANVMVSHQTQSIQRFELLGASEGALGAWTSEATGKGVLRGAVARLFLCSNGLLRTCQDRNRTNLIGIALYGVAAMAGPKTPRELADRMRDHRAQHRARDGFVRETFTQPRDDARQTVREFLDRYPKPAYMSEIEYWRELSGGEIEFTMRRLRTAV